MFDLVYATKFKKDVKRCQKRNWNLDELKKVIDVLRIPQRLEKKYCPHSLDGIYADYQECHIKPDWLLIYRYNNDDNVLYLYRTGTHSELFGM